MKKDNFLTYYSALMLWAMNIWYKCSRNIIGYPMLCFSVFLYKKSDYVKKHFEKLGFTSSEDLKNRYGDYVDSMDPYKDYFCEAFMLFLYFFILNSTILLISYYIIDFDLLRYVAYFGKTVSICMPIVISIVSYIILNCILLRGEKYKIYFKEFDKYKSSQRCKLHFLSVGLIAIIILYGFSPFLLLFEWK